MKMLSWRDVVLAVYKISPEKRVQLEAEIARVIKDVAHDMLVKALSMTLSEIRVEMLMTQAELSDENIELIKNLVRQAMMKNKLASEQALQYEKSLMKRTYLVAYRSATGDFYHLPDNLRDFLSYLENHGGTILFIISEDGSSNGRITRLLEQAKKEAERIGARFY